MKFFRVSLETAKKVAESLKYRNVDGNSVVTIITVEEDEILMQAFANKDAVIRTLTTGFAHYYSTSRRCLWLKGKTSGNLQLLKKILVDCDNDCLIYVVIQLKPDENGFPICLECLDFPKDVCYKSHKIIKVSKGGVACHTGKRSCFFKQVDTNGICEIHQRNK